jgi:hypothetical protein
MMMIISFFSNFVSIHNSLVFWASIVALFIRRTKLFFSYYTSAYTLTLQSLVRPLDPTKDYP